jgi:hypothetical protein
MPRMSSSTLKAMLAAEKQAALSANSSTLSAERGDAMDYYLGDMSKDMPPVDGRSKAVSTDVADTIEGLMPPLMEIFCGSDEVVQFEPVGPEDVAAAQQETEYVNHVFMQKNPGFLTLYSFIKDALLSKVGIVKVWWETKEEEERETYFDQPDDAFALLLADPEVEILEHSERPDPDWRAPPDNPDAPQAKLHDVTLVTRRTYECARVEGVPPEEFGIARNARRICDAGYCFHEVLREQAELIGQGYDPAQIKRLPSDSASGTSESQARDSVDEGGHAQADESENRANRLIRITEHYVRLDYDGDDKPALYRVTTGGDQSEILRRNGEDDVVRQDMVPFAAMTPVIITHRFFGRSIADLVMDIQRIKTALLRALLDNAYLANNPRVEVAESHASEQTLDDLLVSRPGGVVRTKQPGGIQWQVVPTIGNHVYPLLEYQDMTREWRTGVTRQGQGIDANALQNQSATAVNQLFSAAQARVKLIARIFAETGIRDLFSLLHGTIRKHGTKPASVRLRNTWVSVDPREWKSRNDMTINVGLGTGSRSERLAQIMALIGLQKEAVAAGMSNLVSPNNLYNSAKEVAKILELKNTDMFFTDPASQPPPAPQQDPRMGEMQFMVELQKQQAQANIATQSKKVESEMALAQQRFELERQLKLLDAELKKQEHDRKLIGEVFKPRPINAAAAVNAGGEGAAEGEGAAPPQAAGFDPSPLFGELLAALRQVSGPKRVIRDAQNRVIGVEPVPMN